MDRAGERYSRQTRLPGVGPEGQAKLGRSHVLIIGVGGLGSPAAIYLAAAGVGELTLVDPDTVSLSNLQRQILYTTAEVGTLKVDAAHAHLHALNPEVRITTLAQKASAQNLRELVRRADVVLDCSDNFATRYLVNDACVLENKPLIFGAMSRFDAQMSVFHYKGGPCYRCIYPTPPPTEAVANCADAGVLGVMPGTIGTLMATEALKLILDIGEPLSGKLLIYDLLSMQFFRRPLRSDLRCAVCGPQRSIDDLQAPAPSVRELNAEQLRQALKERPCLIDVRSPEEFAAGSVPGAENIPLPELSRDLDRYLRQHARSSWIFICQSGQRSQRAVELLQARGIESVAHVRGGYNALEGSS